MGLKQIKPENRIIFLTKFISELMGNILEEEEKKKRIKVQKLKQKFIEPIHQKRQSSIHKMQIPKKSFIYQIRKPIMTRRQRQPKPIKQIPAKQPPQIPIPKRIQVLTSIQPQAQPRPEGFILGDLEPLLKNPSVQLIECPGPGKNILIKKHNQINITRIVLNQAEIMNIINSFANQAKIPIVGGILKAAVGNMVISAVISEFVGSRFIINKITPYNLIQK